MKVKVKKEFDIDTGNFRDEYGGESLRRYFEQLSNDRATLWKYFSVIWCHSEPPLLADQMLTVFSGTFKKFPLGNVHLTHKNRYVIEEEVSPSDGQLDFYCPVPYANTNDLNIVLRVPGYSREIPYGFVGTIKSDVAEDEIKLLVLGDFSHRFNEFGVKIFNQILPMIEDNDWNQITNKKDVKILAPKSISPDKITIGMDAEFELFDGGYPVEARRFYPFSGEIGHDSAGSPLEFRPKPFVNSSDMLNYTEQLMQEVYNCNHELGTLGDRFAIGTHIHFGIYHDQNFIKLLDNWVAELVWHLNGKGRGSYAVKGSWRNADNHYGFEYRALPSGILRNKRLSILLFKIMEGLANDFYIHEKEIELIPSTNDYLSYLNIDEWNELQELVRGKNIQFDPASWNCKTYTYSIRYSDKMKERYGFSDLRFSNNFGLFIYSLNSDKSNQLWVYPYNRDLAEFFGLSFKYMENCPSIFLKNVELNNEYQLGLSRDALRDFDVARLRTYLLNVNLPSPKESLLE